MSDDKKKKEQEQEQAQQEEKPQPPFDVDQSIDLEDLERVSGGHRRPG